MITDVSGVPELVMNAFEPSITHASPSSFAVVRIARASEPPPGSVRANAPIASPRAIGTSHRSCCSSVPNRNIGFAASPTAASSVIASDWSYRPISSRHRQNESRSPPCPPTSSGNGIPNSPSSAARLTISVGNSSRSSASAAAGATTSSANARTAVRSSSCSGVRSKSTAPKPSGQASEITERSETSSGSRNAWSIWVRSSSSRARSTSSSPPAASTPKTCEIHHTRVATSLSEPSSRS